MTTAVEKLGAVRQAASDARTAAAALRDRIRTGDGRVTGRQLQDADYAIEVAELRIAAAEAEAADEQERHRVDAVHAIADAYLNDEPAARDAFVEAVAALEEALQRVQAAAAAQIEASRVMVRAAARAGSTDRVVYNPNTGAVTIDGEPVRSVTAGEWVRHLFTKAEEQIRPRFEGRALWPAPENAPSSAAATGRPRFDPKNPPWRQPIDANEFDRQEREHNARWTAERAQRHNPEANPHAVERPQTGALK